MLNDRLAGLKVDRLRTFDAVVRHGSFSAAAEALFLPQPRVSQHIADLERLFGVQLFDRSRHPVMLTDNGRRLHPHVQAVLDELTAAQRNLPNAGGLLGGTVVVGMYPSAAAHCYAEVVRHLKQTQPGVEVLLWEGATLELDAALVAGDIDLAIRPSLPTPEHVDRLGCEMLWSEPLVAVFSVDDSPPPRSGIALTDLKDRTLITVGEAHGPSTRIAGLDGTAALETAGLLGAVAYRTNQPQTLVSMVRSGLGIGITNQLAAQTSNHDGVCIVPLVGQGCNREVALWWRSRAPLSASVAAVAEACQCMTIPLIPRA
ncbi:LysR family transcriptional regulator [Mycobacterium sp. 852013-50091_SCH5140682]|uniref:LysR family transcriptional regulator n=1 Tax=Mycobacterium sp. 852013-50091_SCH5140682 TaxID=1834109 RepID=UPI0009ED470F|nr:LysR family transcriptional regulator [Mycobacterium sp. 852013-50091_SCH5140682]